MINKILDQLQDIDDKEDHDRNVKQYSQWVSKYQQELNKLSNSEKGYYLIFLSEVYAIKLKNIDAAYDCLRRVQPTSQSINFQHKLRFCYFRYLEGNYVEALNDLTLIQMSKKTPHFKQITLDFFQRILCENSKGKIAFNSQYEKLLIKALKNENQGKLVEARKIHMSIFKQYKELHPFVEYEAAKHILLLTEQIDDYSGTQMKIYKSKVNEVEARLENKQYYKSKINFLTKIINITIQIQQENILQQQPICNSSYARIYMYLQLKKSLLKIRDQQKINLVQKTRKDITDDNVETNLTCYKYVGHDQCMSFKTIIDKFIFIHPLYKIYGQFFSLAKSIYPKKSKKSILKKHDKSNVISLASDKKQSKNINKTYSHQQEEQSNEPFKGSKMIKIHRGSSGYAQRYFYIKKNFKQTQKLYYCETQKDVDDDNEYYKLKDVKKIIFGKQSESLKRKECNDFDEENCFTLQMIDQQRSFYVENTDDFQNWVTKLVEIIKTDLNKSTAKKTILKI